ncbi:MAG: hypothetical protein JJU22_15005, partial [Gammaproteobacteria bacterium]|nr:hypothetical protein [Gammaproteobacteria bacterium]
MNARQNARCKAYAPVGERYRPKGDAPICMTFSGGGDNGFGRALRDRPNRFAIRAFPQSGSAPLVGERYFAPRNAP